MNRILFVDDELSVLNGIRNALRRERHRWDMVFVTSGADALQEMAQTPFDLIVSDMRMPVMDGADLLMQVRQHYPQTARIVLSGHSDHQAIVRVLPAANQFLAKPCAPEHLAAVIERTCSLQATLDNPAMRKLTGSLDRLPSAPLTYHALTQAIATPGTRIDQIVHILDQDPAMCAKILQLVNSSYFGSSRTITSLHNAIVYLGLDLIRALTLSAHVFGEMEVSGAVQPCLEEMRNHSFQIATLARLFLAGSKEAEEVFSVGMVHDVGSFVLALAQPDDYLAALERGHPACLPDHGAEIEMFGTSHAEVGAYLLGTWGLPIAMVEAVAYHHRPSEMVAGSRMVAALHVADTLVGAAGADAEEALDRAYLDRSGVAAEIDNWIRIAKKLEEEVS